MKYEELIQDKIEELAFLELMEDSNIDINGRIFEGPLPLPILASGLISVVKDRIDDVPLALVAEGIVYSIGILPDYEYNEVYFEILEAYVGDVKGYIQKGAYEKLEEEDISGALVYLKALKNLGYEDEKSLFALGTALENIDISNYSENEKLEHAVEIMKIYENSLNKNPEFPLAHYKLGYIYKEFGQFLKSKMTFQKALNLDTNDFRRQEIRDVLNDIEDDVILETAILKMEKGNFAEALYSLESISSNNIDDVVYYHISLCHYNLGNIEAAIEAIDTALGINDIPVYHNQLALLYEKSGDAERAIKELENTIDITGPDYLLNYNLATMQYNLGDSESALVNFEIAYEINQDESLREIIDYLKSN